MPDRFEDFLTRRAALLMRLAGVIAICSGLIGGFVWLIDLEDRSDGDSLRWGSWHNPFMQFPPFNEPFLDLSMWILLGCSAAAGLGGILLLIPLRFGALLVTWQARLAFIVNAVIVFFIVAVLIVDVSNPPGEFYVDGLTYRALALRSGSIAINLLLWMFLGSNAVHEFFLHQSQHVRRGFDVIAQEPVASDAAGQGPPQ
jgi:hypothetical protein